MALRRVATFGPLAERWNGTGWRIESAPAPSSGNRDQRYGFQSVSCAAAACMGVALAVTGDGKSLSELRR
jgi:hypothetical protein